MLDVASAPKRHLLNFLLATDIIQVGDIQHTSSTVLPRWFSPWFTSWSLDSLWLWLLGMDTCWKGMPCARPVYHGLQFQGCDGVIGKCHRYFQTFNKKIVNIVCVATLHEIGRRWNAVNRIWLHEIEVTLGKKIIRFHYCRSSHASLKRSWTPDTAPKKCSTR